MSHRSGRHTHGGANAVPVREFLASGVGMPAPHGAGSFALRRPTDVAKALTAATAIAFAPMVVSQAPPIHVALPAVHVADMHLTAVVSDADIKNLINAVNTGLNQLDSTVANVAGVPGQTLAGALSAASGLTNNFWSTLIGASQSNPLLANVLSALQTVTSGGLTKLAATTTSVNGTIGLTTGQVASLLTNTLTGSAATLLYAISNVVNNPLSLLSYAGLINAPVTILGGVVSNAASAASALGAGAISLIGNVVTGATAQVSNLITAANAVVNGIEQTINQQQVNSLITIAAQIVTSPLTAAITLINGATSAAADVATTTVQVAATAVQRVNNIWLSNGNGNGVIQGIVNTIAGAPLSPGSYVNVFGELITGAAESVQQVGSAVVGGFLPLPFRVSATMVSATAGALGNLADGLAKGTVAALELAGVSPLLAGTVYGLVGAVKTAMSFTAGTITTALNAVAALASAAVSVTGMYNPAAATPAAATAPTARSLSAAPTAAAAKAPTPAASKPSTSAALTSSAQASPTSSPADAPAPAAVATVAEWKSTAAEGAATPAAGPKNTATVTGPSSPASTSTTGVTPTRSAGTGSSSTSATATGSTTTAAGGSTSSRTPTPATATGKGAAAEGSSSTSSPAKKADAATGHTTAKTGAAPSASTKAESPSGTATHTANSHAGSGASSGHEAK